MKEKTSVTLSREVLKGIDRLAGSKLSRSALIDDVLAQYLRDMAHAEIEARDIALLNQAAEELGEEIEEVLRDQGEVI